MKIGLGLGGAGNTWFSLKWRHIEARGRYQKIAPSIIYMLV